MHIEIIKYFLKLGFVGFGGPLALIASFQKELVEKRKWLSLERFSQSLTLIKALPGPTATQIAIYLGLVRGGKLGGALAGLCIILPPFVMMLLLAYFYENVRSFSWSKTLLSGMQVAALGVITESILRLIHPYKKITLFWIVAFFSGFLTYFFPSAEPLFIIGAGILGIAYYKFGFLSLALLGFGKPILGLLPKLSWVCFKAGAFVFGTGLAVVPMLAHDVVENHHWLTHTEFMDALAFGQITPGPVVITVTFIGYKVAGFFGAVCATTAVFAPAFFNILTWFPVVEKRFLQNKAALEFTKWAMGAVIGALAVTILKLSLPFFNQDFFFLSVLLFVFAFLLSLFGKAPPWLIIIGGGGILQIVLT